MANSIKKQLSLNLKGRLLYAINHGYPYSSNGYAVRTHGVASALVSAGCHVIAVAQPSKHPAQSAFSGLEQHVFDGVKYLHTPPAYRSASHMTELLTELACVYKPVAIMGASNWRNAQPACAAAQKLGLPFYYEVRGFWEISRLAREPSYRDTAEFANDVAQETQLACSATHVFTLNRFMKAELVRRGVDETQISLVPNGFFPPPLRQCTKLNREAMGLKAQFVVGYVGSFNEYEGLELLIEACALLRRAGIDVAVLLVGSGQFQGFVDPSKNDTSLCPKTVALRQLACRLNIEDSVVLPGRVPAEQAGDYYGLIDVVVIPRKPLEVCELVMPMKPLEAASFGKPVLMSDVAPIKDLEPLYGGFYYFAKGSLDSLVERLADVLQMPTQVYSTASLMAQSAWTHRVEPMASAFLSLPGVAGRSFQ
jgi:glycosyltransferase involved in cell wall biosynthesis